VQEDFLVTEGWKKAYPSAAIGMLVIGNAANPREHPQLEARKEALVSEIRTEFASYDREALKVHPVLSAYQTYYKRFKKTYHVQHQLESIAHKGKSIPKVAALVESMFMAELQNLLLTAGHDMDRVVSPVRVDIATGDETYTRLNGQEQSLKPKDMFISDSEGVLSCILYGPDQRTRIGPDTQRALFTVYAPPGIGSVAVHEHLEDILGNVMLVAPSAETEFLHVFTTE
jgi:DNA/RNA-binding domain of Phe-tRNA-synthetase-like protein